MRCNGQQPHGWPRHMGSAFELGPSYPQEVAGEGGAEQAREGLTTLEAPKATTSRGPMPVPVGVEVASIRLIPSVSAQTPIEARSR